MADAPPPLPIAPKMPDTADKATKAAPPPALPPADAVADGAAIAHQIGFWQQPWVQNVLPFVTSFVLHVGLIIFGYTALKVTQVVYNKVTQEQVIIPDATLAENGPPGGIVNPGTGGDPTRRAEQNIDDSVTQSDGWAQKKGEALQASIAGGGAGESDGDNTIGAGMNSAFGKGKGQGSGSGDGMGGGAGGDGAGVLAPFGTPGGGGGIGPKAPFAGMGGNARQIVYLCDASGTMQSVFSSLRDELKKSVGVLVPGQFFNVIFFTGDNVIAYNKGGLIMANPDNKKKLYDFVDDVSPKEGTNPFPAINAAFDNKPQLIYVLTDGFDQVDSLEAVYQEFAKRNADKKVKVNCILLSSDPSRDKSLVDLLQRIAKDNGGSLKIINKDQF